MVNTSAPRLQTGSGSGRLHQHGAQRAAASLFVLWGSLWLCAASLSPAGQTAPRLSARFYFAPRLWLLIVFFFYLSPPLNILFPSNYHCASILLSSCHLCLPSVSLLLCHITPPPPSGLCRAVAVHRSEQDRWSRRIFGLCSFLQGTAWYCCWHDALSGCLQVQEFNTSCNVSLEPLGRDNDSAPAHTLLCVIPSLLYVLTSL